jgi:ATP-binding cassette subfamily B protein
LPGSIGSAISTLRDDVGAIASMDDWASDVVAAVIFAGGGIGVMLYVDAWVTMLVLVPVLAVIVLAHAARARAHQLRERSRAATASVTGMIGEIVTATSAIRAAAKEDAVLAELNRLGEQRKRAMVRDRVRSLALDAVFDSTAGLGATLTLLFAAARLRSGEFSTGDFVLFSTYLMQVAGYTGFIGHLIRTYQQIGPSLRRTAALLQGAPAATLIAVRVPRPVKPAAVSAEPFRTLQVAGLECGVGVRDVSFSLDRGSITVITGMTGAGKTTLLRALLGLLPLASGTIRWNGLDIEDPGGFMVPPRVAYTGQTPDLLSGTMRDNILLGHPDDGRAAEAARRAMLSPDLAALPAGLDTEIGVRGIRLSGGQVQRVAAARMFACQPELMVVDDLSSALDVETEHDLWADIGRTGITCLAVSHRPMVLRRADQVLLMDGGRVVAAGPYTELLGSYGAVIPQR